MNYTEKVITVLELLKSTRRIAMKFLIETLKLRDCEIKSIIHDLRYMGYDILSVSSYNQYYYQLRKSIELNINDMKEYEVYATMDLWHDIISPNLKEVIRYVSSFTKSYEPYYLKGYRKYHGIEYGVFYDLVLLQLKNNDVVSIIKKE